MREIEFCVFGFLTSDRMELRLKPFKFRRARVRSERSFVAKKRFGIRWHVRLAFFSFSKLAGRGVPNHRIQPVDDIHPSANFFAAGKRRADANESTNSREYCQH